MSENSELVAAQQLETSSLVLSPSEDQIDNEALSVARAEELSRSFTDTSLPRGFYFDEDDWLAYLSGTGGDKEAIPTKICSRLEVIARTRDLAGENHGRLLQFYDPDGIQHRWSMPMALLSSDGTAYRQELLSKGLLIAPGKAARQLLTTYIQNSTPSTTVRCVEHTGWNANYTAFVFPNETLGQSDCEPLILQAATALPTAQVVSGSLQDWQKLAALCVGNSRLIFTVSAAFAPPLLSLLEVENGGVHFRGGSSSGKTTCLRAAASVWGGWDYVQQWRATANGLEGIAAAHNDCMLCLDEMGQIDPIEVGKVAYMLANGVGKTRADKLGGAQKQKRWRLLFLSSGEISLNDHMAEGNQRSRPGQEVRVLDITADGQAYGCFQNLHGFGQAKGFAEHVAALCKSYHGSAGKAFIERLLIVREKVISDARALMSDLSKKHVPVTASGQVFRVFNRFALIAAAGELATSFGITGWPEGSAIEAALVCFDDWLRTRGYMGPQEEKSILSQVRHFFEQHGDSRFTLWHEDSQDKQGKTLMRVGYRKPSEEGEEYFVFPESFKREIASGFDPTLVAQICLRYGLLIPDSKGGATRSERLPGAKNSSRVYRFSSRVLSEGVDVCSEK